MEKLRIEIDIPDGYFELFEENYQIRHEIFKHIGFGSKYGKKYVMRAFKERIKQLAWGEMIDDKKRIQGVNAATGRGEG